MLNTLLELHKQGIQIFMTEEGWYLFLQLMSEVEMPEEAEEVM